ncbi:MULTISPECIES: hypothetical protein [Haloarcula]|uniref:hypothetical protein n=1 Tax=Haloarcula TaxID=2237 RepID=UPI0023ED5CB6|nr:hypothetical protein [Halomicroarcula sp. XH51]
MKVRNSQGRAVDPVPFLVVATTGVLLSYVFFPAYLLSFGASLSVALAGATAIATLVSIAAFHRYCWSVRPELRREVPSQQRFKRLVYGMGMLAGVLLLLALPFFH